MAAMERLGDYTDDLITLKRQRSLARAVVTGRGNDIGMPDRITSSLGTNDKQALDIVTRACEHFGCDDVQSNEHPRPRVAVGTGLDLGRDARSPDRSSPASLRVVPMTRLVWW
jgi:hypothetical protein